jgi:hypothetical protein
MDSLAVSLFPAPATPPEVNGDAVLDWQLSVRTEENPLGRVSAWPNILGRASMQGFLEVAVLALS